MTFTIYLGAIIGGLAAGTALGYGIRAVVAKNKINHAEITAEKIIKEAQIKEKDLLLQAKNKALQTIEEAKRDDENRRKELRLIQQKLEKHEAGYEQRVQDLQKKQEQLFERNNQVESLRSELQKAKEEETKKLEAVAVLTQDEAKEILMKSAEEMINEGFANRIRKLERANTEEYERRARTMLSSVIQRIASSHSVETTTTAVQIPNDEMKGRIIGKEGRNIKAIEHLTGTEIIIDDTPNAITVSGFSPIRRQVARIAIEKLIEDGRIHPTRIEECVEQAKKDLAVDIKKAGEDAFFELGVPMTGLDPKFIQILGRLKYRTSYGQNVLKHSLEVGTIAGLLAAELGADVAECKKGGLLHDVGKAVDHDVQGAHPEIGYNIMKKFGLPEEIAYHSIGHHEDHPRTLEAVIVKAADAISGARPGARKDTYEFYIQRLEELERAACDFPGVEKAYAIQAGREVRVFVEPKVVDDFGAFRLAKDIACKIESELKYPGEIKVNVIRETRVVEYAR